MIEMEYAKQDRETGCEASESDLGCGCDMIRRHTTEGDKLGSNKDEETGVIAGDADAICNTELSTPPFIRLQLAGSGCDMT